MEFKINHGTSNRYYLTVNNNPAPFAQLFENKHNSREKDPELVAACRLVKAAPKLLKALELAQYIPLTGNPSHQQLVEFWEYEKTQGREEADDQLFILSVLAEARGEV